MLCRILQQYNNNNMLGCVHDAHGGAVDRRGQHKSSVYYARGPYQMIQRKMEQIFEDFFGFVLLMSCSDT